MKNKQYLLDTNILIDFLAKEKKEEYYNNEIKKINKLIEYFDILPLSHQAEQYGKIKSDLKKKGEIIDEFDMLIAGQALSENLTVVTDNIKHFNRIDGLKITNWLKK